MPGIDRCTRCHSTLRRHRNPRGTRRRFHTALRTVVAERRRPRHRTPERWVRRPRRDRHPHPGSDCSRRPWCNHHHRRRQRCRIQTHSPVAGTDRTTRRPGTFRRALRHRSHIWRAVRTRWTHRGKRSDRSPCRRTYRRTRSRHLRIPDVIRGRRRRPACRSLPSPERRTPRTVRGRRSRSTHRRHIEWRRTPNSCCTGRRDLSRERRRRQRSIGQRRGCSRRRERKQARRTRPTPNRNRSGNPAARGAGRNRDRRRTRRRSLGCLDNPASDTRFQSPSRRTTCGSCHRKYRHRRFSWGPHRCMQGGCPPARSSRASMSPVSAARCRLRTGPCNHCRSRPRRRSGRSRTRRGGSTTSLELRKAYTRPRGRSRPAGTKRPWCNPRIASDRRCHCRSFEYAPAGTSPSRRRLRQE